MGALGDFVFDDVEEGAIVGGPGGAGVPEMRRQREQSKVVGRIVKGQSDAQVASTRQRHW
jgi:hypothetical protein